jgi:hypothetical protein
VNLKKEAERVVSICHREALKPVCSRRGVDLSSLDVFLENSKAPLSVMTDTSWLGGKQLQLRGSSSSLPLLSSEK